MKIIYSIEIIEGIGFMKITDVCNILTLRGQEDLSNQIYENYEKLKDKKDKKDE